MKTELVTSLATFDERPDDEYELRFSDRDSWREFDWRREDLGTAKELIDLGRLRRIIEEPELPEFKPIGGNDE